MNDVADKGFGVFALICGAVLAVAAFTLTLGAWAIGLVQLLRWVMGI